MTVETVPSYAQFTPGPVVLDRLRVQSAAQGLVMTDNGSHEHLSSSIRDCHIVGEKSWKNGQHANRVDWGIRAYDFAGVIKGCEIERIGSEHAIYINPAGNLSVEGCHLHHLGGQALQLYFRDWESSDPKRFRAAEKHLGVYDCLVRQVGRNLPCAERQGFALTFGDVGPETYVVVRGSFLRTVLAAFKAHGGWWNSYGAIVVQRAERVTLTDTYVQHRRPDRPVIQVERAGRVDLEGCVVTEGLIDLQNVERLGVKGCEGNATVRLRGQVLGEIGELALDV